VVQRPPAGTIPETPRSYQFRGAHGRVIYVGKARNLRERLANYFQKPPQHAPAHGADGGHGRDRRVVTEDGLPKKSEYCRFSRSERWAATTTSRPWRRCSAAGWPPTSSTSERPGCLRPAPVPRRRHRQDLEHPVACSDLDFTALLQR